MAFGEVGHPIDRVEVAGVDLAGVRDHDRRAAVQGSEACLERLEVDPAGRVASQPADVAGADSEHRQRLHGGGVDVAAGEHRDLRRVRQTVLGGALPKLLAAPVASRGEADEVRHCAAGDQDSAELRRKREQVAEPVQADRFEAAGERRGGPNPGVLVERGGQPVSGQGAGGGAADDEMEEAWPGGARCVLAAQPGQVRDRCGGARALLGERAAQLHHRLLAAWRLNRVAVELGQEGARLGRGELERLFQLGSSFSRVTHRLAC